MPKAERRLGGGKCPAIRRDTYGDRLGSIFMEFRNAPAR